MNNREEARRQINQRVTAEEGEGVKMIVALQTLASIEEPLDHALANWRAMSEAEKQQTREVYALFFPGGE